ncbi:hypothetical protein DICPUDRAFT_87778 [Dictyostelium purpureum]|uniref:Cytochrome P450 family protein n=1 Tax=Dictyostelium purpureum TaxID=5786 RepID=F0ZKA1_DICPU|nr:uncharacterized protein DICPUDRAFT_87778 [Dictyostelium purpureum]EGC35606.1 hypothetical protein DICPUDRAFT_87778 [Dictyostelium purpureum]|eukprot:XP_003287843.1 hypothetical protein DICPUDRAFT_87778 [Dictyostelium purpureum]
MNLLFIFISLIIFFIIYYYYKFFNYDNHKLKLKGPFPLPILGNLHQFGTKSPQLKLTEYSQQYKHIFRMWMGDKYSVIVSDPKLIREMLIENFSAFKDRPFSAKLAFGNNYHGTTTGNGDYWDRNRDIVSRALRKSSNKTLYDFLNQKVSEFMTMVDNRFKEFNTSGADENEYIILEKPRFLIQRYTISIMYKFIFNEDIKFSNENEEDSKELKFFFRTIKEIFKVFSASTLIDFISVLQPLYFQYLKKTDTLFPKIFSFINSKYQQHLSEMSFEGNEVKSKPKDLLESLIYEYGKDKPTESDVQSILTTCLDFFLAGTETSSTAIEWILLNLINRPEYQSKIYSELKNLDKQTIKVQDKLETPLLVAFIKETLRIHPVAPFGLPHECTRNVVIDNKYFIPMGSQLLINFKGIAYNENCFKYSKSFYPERFIDSKIENDSFLIFGIGQRNCVGNQIALDEIYLLISNLILKYRFESIDGKKIQEIEKLSLTLYPKKFNIKIIKRSN